MRSSELGERRLVALCQLDIAKIAAVRGDEARALTLLKRAVDELATGGIAILIWEAVRSGAIVLTLVLQQPETALKLFAAAGDSECINRQSGKLAARSTG